MGVRRILQLIFFSARGGCSNYWMVRIIIVITATQVSSGLIKPIKSYSALLATSHCTLRRKDSLCVLACWFCVSRKGGTGGGGCGHRLGAVHMVAARLGFEMAMVGTGRATPRPDCMDRLNLQRAGFWQERLLGL